MAYHVWANGVAGLPIFATPEDRDHLVRLLREEVRHSGWTCLQYVVMSTHLHALIVLHQPTLSRGFQRLHLRYAQYFNKLHERRGHVFSSRFDSRTLETDEDRLEVSRYITLNPTRARMCEKPEDYPWSGHAAIARLFAPDGVVDVAAALEPFGGSADAYREYVDELDPRVRRTRAQALADARRRSARRGRRPSAPPALRRGEQRDELAVQRAVRRQA